MSFQTVDNTKKRKTFSKIPPILDIPNLLNVQTESYKRFLQEDVPPEKRAARDNHGLQAVFSAIFPIENYGERTSLEFVHYSLGQRIVDEDGKPVKDGNGHEIYDRQPKFDETECRLKGYDYTVSLYVTLRLIVWEEEDGNEIRDIAEQDVYFGEIPKMTDNGSFIIGGAERVIVNQIHRSPGVLFDGPNTGDQSHSSAKESAVAKIIPQDGRWLDFDFDSKNFLNVRIDRRKRFLATLFLKALGYTERDILNLFYKIETVIFDKDGGGISKKINPETIIYQKSSADIKKGSDIVVKKGRKFTARTVEKLASLKIDAVPLESDDDIIGKVCAETVINSSSGEVIAVFGETITEKTIQDLRDNSADSISFYYMDDISVSSSVAGTLLEEKRVYGTLINNTFDMIIKQGKAKKSDLLKPLSDLPKDKVSENEDHFVVEDLTDNDVESLRSGFEKIGAETETFCHGAITEIYRKFRPTDPPSREAARTFFTDMFFNSSKYRLSQVGRKKLNYKLKHNVDEGILVLTREDIIQALTYLLELKGGQRSADDIDHLGNRRVKTVGELIEETFYSGLERFARSVRERIGYQSIENKMPREIVVPKVVDTIVKDFFKTGQLSQFMDQTNPLSEITHKRRLSALGPKGLTRERAGFAVRDVHSSHYGRICPVETPEGPNIGLISSISTYAEIDSYGFIRAPYRVVENGRVTNQIVRMSALEEEEKDIVIAQANAPLNEKGEFVLDFVSSRSEGEIKMVEKDRVTHMDVSPSQLVSISASLIPFLEHDDANRALMGSNMQRQAAPLIRAVPPLVGTGLEASVARDSGVAVIAGADGEVIHSDAEVIVVKNNKSVAKSDKSSNLGVDVYKMIKFRKSNQGTCWNQTPIVSKGQKVKKGQVIADGPSTKNGELALGQNVVVAFMPWGGYNFEDAILISERVVKDNVFTSVHIEEFECQARETKLGREEITRDIPNVGEDALRNLDESGIIRVGATVNMGDILVGKISPKGEMQLSQEEKLLRAIFGDKARDVKDTSLKSHSSIAGTVIDVKVLTSRSVEEKSARAKEIEIKEIEKIKREMQYESDILEHSAREDIASLLKGKKAVADIVKKGEKIIPKGDPFTAESLRQLALDDIKEIKAEEAGLKKRIEEIVASAKKEVEDLRLKYEDKKRKLEQKDDLPPSVLKTVKVYVAVKMNLQVGDKMAGRHGNKGVISKILPQEDMPYMEDGTPVDMVLNPLGVPSRMNVGQVLETHLGLASKEIGRQLNEYIEENYGADAIKSKLKKVYGGRGKDASFIDKLTEEQSRNFIASLKEGIPVASPVFDGANEDEIKEFMELAGLDDDGKTILFDGLTGEPFDQKVTVGVMYMLKLHHLVEEKIHARSIGPYSLVTQQPLGGKAHFGGQRLGEMEVWALEAYGAAHTLQEFLTVKSDDVNGRTKMFASIVEGKMSLEPGLPESFNVLRKELQSLGLQIDLTSDESGEDSALGAAG
ncbi:MAG: DNA-directed RNA polymerase subunit beta [Candidatus Dadabacteria bacterium]|nr:DNA-directed RNA polymerase subunit beta [Candidatus Dadabacteria bacterium]